MLLQEKLHIFAFESHFNKWLPLCFVNKVIIFFVGEIDKLSDVFICKTTVEVIRRAIKARHNSYLSFSIQIL